MLVHGYALADSGLGLFGCPICSGVCVGARGIQGRREILRGQAVTKAYAVDARSLSKRYFLGDPPTAGELLGEALRTFVVGLRGIDRAAGENSREMWALDDVSFTVQEGERL